MISNFFRRYKSEFFKTGVIGIMFIILSPIYGQKLDSSAVNMKFEQYQFADDASLQNYYQLFLEYQNKLSTESQIAFGTKGADAALASNNDSLYVEFYLEVIKVCAIQLYDIEKTRELLGLIEKKIELLNNELYNAKYYNFKGICYYLEGEYNDALKYYMQSYENSKNLYPQRAKGTLYNISKIYNQLNNYRNSIKFAQEALLLNEKLPKRERILNTALSNHLISLSYEKGDFLDSAFHHTEKAILALDRIDTIKTHSELQIYCDVNLDALHYYLKKNDWDKIDSILEGVKKCKGKVEPLYSIALANYYLAVKDFEQVGKIIKDSTYRRSNFAAEHYQLYLESQYQEGIGNYKKALKAERAYTKTLEELTRDEILEYTAFADARFETTKNQEEIKRLKLVTETENLKSRILLFALLLSIGLIAIGFFAFRRLKLQNELIEHQAKELKKIDILKSKLFSNISHELRTPLTLISEPVKKLIERASLDENTKRQLFLAQKSSQRLLSLSNQIMDLTKSEIGQIKLNPVRFYWDDFVDNTIPPFRITAEERGLSFVVTKHFEENILLQSDLSKLKVVVANLLQNALKYNRLKGTVKFVSYHIDGQLGFYVEDTGIGIDQSELSSVFDRYYQSVKISEAEGGFGIGLAVCKEYVELLGGKITIESKLGRGTKVDVIIPITIGGHKTAPFHSFEELDYSAGSNNIPQEQVNATLNRHHLLVVEDNADLREFLKTILLEEYTLTFATNGFEALEKLKKITPSLIITDWMMPTMNGLELIQKLKKDERYVGIPVLVLTARSLPTDRFKAFRIGANDYLLKPFETDFLKSRIEYLLENSKIDEAFIHSNESKDKYSISSKEEGGFNEKNVAWISNLEEIIYKQINDLDLVTEKIAKEVNLSTTQLNRKVKAITGLTTMQFVDEIRFWEARRLLEEKEIFSVKAVSYSVGFKSVKNFSRNFKKKFGKNPSDLLTK